MQKCVCFSLALLCALFAQAQTLERIIECINDNRVPTSFSTEMRPNKVYIGPLNAVMGANSVEGFRLRLGGDTTPQASRTLLLRGWIKYGFADKRWKTLAEATYSFVPKKRSRDEYPVRSLAVSFTRDVLMPTARFTLLSDDNLLQSWRWTPTTRATYTQRVTLNAVWDLNRRTRIYGQIRNEQDDGAAELAMPHLVINEATAALTHRNLTLRHTAGLWSNGEANGFHNYSEASYNHTFKLKHGGEIATQTRLGAQWNTDVPLLLRAAPSANLSYFTTPWTYSLLSDDEFVGLRFAQTMLHWDGRGTFFHRSRLLKSLGATEVAGASVLWNDQTGGLPYAEVSLGVHNILQVIGLDYVHRLTHRSKPSQGWGLRIHLTKLL